MLKNIRIAYVLPVVAALIVIGSLWYSNSLVRKLAKQEEKMITFYRDVLQYIATNDNGEVVFLFNKVIQGDSGKKIISVPSIQTDAKGKPISDNLFQHTQNDTSEKQKLEQQKVIEQELEAMKADLDHPPLQIEFAKGQYNYIYYRESDVLKQLRYYPYVTLIIIVVFIGIIFANYHIAQRNQQNKVWVGLAKETAHQLGTPISGLLAWLEILKNRLKKPDNVEVVTEMSNDVLHLQNIAERFSKIGSEPELTPYPITPLLQKITDYMRMRISQSGKITVQLENQLPDDQLIMINPVLFEWVIENLLKNAIDALINQTGAITLRAKLKDNQIIIDIEDTGKGIAPSNLKSVFNPGFTTKKRGWGLGLSLSRRIIVNYHKGKIFVKHSEINKGTTFRIVLSEKINKI